jgi:molybdopterin-guanine dinucleotide biosynthesis protein A
VTWSMRHPRSIRVGGIVVCGGKSSRMGRAKAWLELGRETFLQRVVRVLGEVVSPVVVVAAVGQELPPLPDDVEIVRDEFEGKARWQGWRRVWEHCAAVATPRMRRQRTCLC